MNQHDNHHHIPHKLTNTQNDNGESGTAVCLLLLKTASQSSWQESPGV